VDIFSVNQVQNLKNKLTFTSLVKSIGNILVNYVRAVKKFGGEEEVSPLSYSLVIKSNNPFLYIKKEIEESLDYIRN
jgi:hypothetical protein